MIVADRTSYLPVVDNMGSWSRIFTETRLWQTVVSDICRSTGLADGRQIDSAFPGTCAVFIVDWAIVVKVFPPFLSGDCRSELEVYRILAAQLEPYVPELLAHGVFLDRVDWSYLVLSFKPGLAIREVRPYLLPANSQSIALELGWIIETLHELPLTESDVFDDRPEAWRAFVRERLEQSLIELNGVLSAPLLRETAEFLQHTLLLEQPDSFRPCLLNGDLTEDHLLLVEQFGEWRISAVIDWADALAGAVEYEWVAMWFGLCAQDLVMFRAILRSYDPAIRLDYYFRERMMAYTLIHRFGPQIIDHVLTQSGAPIVSSFAELQAWLWPPMVD